MHIILFLELILLASLVCGLVSFIALENVGSLIISKLSLFLCLLLLPTLQTHIYNTSWICILVPYCFVYFSYFLCKNSYCLNFHLTPFSFISRDQAIKDIFMSIIMLVVSHSSFLFILWDLSLVLSIHNTWLLSSSSMEGFSHTSIDWSSSYW